MTRAACEFITPLTFAALTGKKVITEMFAAENAAPANVESAIEHIAVAQRIDLLLVAPATADTLSKFAHGAADDFLSTLYLAFFFSSRRRHTRWTGDWSSDVCSSD